MRKKEYASYFILAITLFIFLNLPFALTKKLRSTFLVTTKLFAKSLSQDEALEIVRLRVENASLKEQIGLAREWLTAQDRIEEHTKKIEEVINDPKYGQFHKTRVRNLKASLKEEVYAVEAKVIFRDPAFWSSGFWVNKGEKENRRQGFQVVAKNSPVTLGSTLIGIIEEVEENRSYVRLITDSSLTPAVRAIRGGEQNEALLCEIAHLQEHVALRDDLVTKQDLLALLEAVSNELRKEHETSFLVKGELRGSSYPLWRSRSNILKGIGFNYEYADDEGPSREIHEKSSEALLKVGDLLVTSGLDGVFPKNLNVATVSKIYPLKEGGFAYDIEAIAELNTFRDLHFVQISPPLLALSS